MSFHQDCFAQKKFSKKVLIEGLRDLAQSLDSMTQTDDNEVLVGRVGQMQEELENLVDDLGLTTQVY